MMMVKVRDYVIVSPSVIVVCPKLVTLTKSIMAEPKIADFIAKTETSK